MTRYFLIALAIICLAGCQDTKSTKKETITKTTIVTTPKLAEKKPEPPKLGTPKNPFMPDQYAVKPFLKKYGEENRETKVRISTSFGDIDLQLYNDTPLHRANFILMVKEGYFDLTEFYRVSPSFVIQGGNSDSRKMGRKRNAMGDYLIPNESKYRHNRGALAAAKFVEQNISNASSPFEFYIVQSTRGAHHLNKEHTVFGRVTKGMDVVDEINKVSVDQSEWPLEKIPMTVTIIE